MVVEKIRAIIADKLEIDEDIVLPESTLESLHIDSLYLVEIMMAIEEEFNIVIEDSEGLNTVADIVAYTEKKLA